MNDFLIDGAPTIVASAPGRLDVMGGIADYSGSLVLELPLDRRTTVRAQRQTAPTIDIATCRGGEIHRTATYPIASLFANSPETIAAQFPPHADDHWAAYVLGVAYACLVKRSVVVDGGIRLLIESDVPEGKGVSSSAALEVSCLAAIAQAFEVELSAEEIATECQWAENHVAGAPCGIMDQMTSACGRRDHLLRLRCQPATIEGHVAIPTGFRFYGIDSGIRHAVTGADYGTVRTAAFMGYRMIAALGGFYTEHDGDRVAIDDPKYGGYLANITPLEFAEQLEHHLPEQMLGADFLATFHGLTDTVTRVHADSWYPVRAATAHPVHENARVESFSNLLGALPDSAHEMGALMYASHASYSACGLGSDGTDLLVALVQQQGAPLYGAKITGGGSGGTVAVLATDDAEPLVRDLVRQYEAETGRVAEVFAGSGDGMQVGA